MKKHFLYLFLFAVICACFTGCKPSVEIDEDIYDILDLTNELRQEKYGAGKNLVLDSDLCKIAQKVSDESVYTDDIPPVTEEYIKNLLLTLDGDYTFTGANFLKGTTTGEATFARWENDTRSKNVMLNGDATKVGIAYTYAPDSVYKVYWTMILAK